MVCLLASELGVFESYQHWKQESRTAGQESRTGGVVLNATVRSVEWSEEGAKLLVESNSDHGTWFNSLYPLCAYFQVVLSFTFCLLGV